MSQHTIHREVWLPHPREKVFEFFSAARNLEQITPPLLQFQVLTPEPIQMEEGRLIEYKLKIRGLPMRWLTKITRWNPPYEFADVQLKGPYKLWDHRHRFIVENSGTRMIDDVTYELPLGPLGDLVHGLMVKRDVEEIFRYRNGVISTLFA